MMERKSEATAPIAAGLSTERILSSSLLRYQSIPSIIRTLVVPIVVLHAITRVVLATTPFTIGITAPPITSWYTLLAFPLMIAATSYLSSLRKHLEAKRLGFVPSPRVKGRWLLNIDVLLGWLNNKREDVTRTLFVMERKYGLTYNTRVLAEDTIISTDPRVFRQVFVDDFSNFIKGPKFRSRVNALFGDGIFNSDGERWAFHRTLTRPFFHHTHINPSTFIPHIKRALDSIPIGTPFDAQALFSQLSLEMAIMWLIREDIGIQKKPRSPEWESAKLGLSQAMKDSQAVVARRLKVGWPWPLFELSGDPIKGPVKVIKQFLRPLIIEAVDRREQGKTENPHLIDRLVGATDDLPLIEDQLINILTASRDTTASLITFMTYVICLMPEVAARLRKEIDMVVGDDNRVTKDHVRELRLCRAFINETLRLFPPVPFNIRRAVESCGLPATSDHGVPIYMPAKASIVLATAVMQRSKAVWGEDAEEFKLDRWLGGLEGTQREGFVSFSLGPRMCAGQPMALTIAHTYLVILFQTLRQNNVELTLAPEAQPKGTSPPPEWSGSNGDGRLRGGRDKIWAVSDLILSVKGGLWLRSIPSKPDDTG